MATTNGSKNFIINHMNADHQDSLVLYLRVYSQISASEAKSARLEDISLSDLVITANGTRYSVPVNPPMQSFSDARSRVVAMHKECLQRLGLSDITVREYRAPWGGHAVFFAFCIAVLLGFPRQSDLVRGSALYDSVGLGKVPSFGQLLYNLQPYARWIMIVIHTVEAALFAVYRLQPHSVPFLSGVWFTWMASVLIEGGPAWVRFGGIIREEREKREHGKKK